GYRHAGRMMTTRRQLTIVALAFRSAVRRRAALKGCATVSVVVALLVVVVFAQSSEPQLTILSPGDGAYVSGPTLLRAKVEPIDAVAGVTFFVDGRQACALTRVPYECDWDAGAAIAEHQVRAVATLKGGGRVVHTVRTKSVGYAERVDVDVVQVT